MANYVTLDNVEHAKLKVFHQYGEEFGDLANQTRAFVTEFEALQREYPILFRKMDTGEFYAVCILGLDANENLFLDGNAWTGRYVPAALRRGPFKIAMQQLPGEAARPNISINLDDVRVGTEHGIPLFKPNGGLSAYLNQITATLNLIHLGMHRERDFFVEMEKLSLLTEITVQIKVSEDKGYTIPGVFTVSKERLLELSDAEIAGAHRSGLLELCYWAMSSLRNTDNLLERKLSQRMPVSA